MSDPYASDGAVDPVSPAASGVYIEGNSTYASTIDSAVDGLYVKTAYDAGCAAAGALPIVCMVHGYAGDADSLQQSDLRRWAARGFLAASFGMRGRNGATGSRDASGRELHDLIDGMAHLRTLFATLVRADHAGGVGWSGGGGNILGMRARTDLFTVTADFFGIANYGPGATGWYDYGVGLGSHTLLETDIGGTPTALPLAYLCRDTRMSVAVQMGLGGWLHVLHDASDGSVSVQGSDDLAANLAALGRTNYTFTRTTAASPTRALHGHPVDHAELPLLERIFARRMRDTTPLVIPAAGTILMQGFYRSFTRDFELWLGDAPSPRTNGTGGTNRRAQVLYDTTAGRYVVTPLDGPGYLYLRHGSSFEATSVATANRTLVIDAAARTIAEISNDLDAAPVTWTASQGASPTPPPGTTWLPTGASAVDWTSALTRRQRYVAP